MSYVSASVPGQEGKPTWTLFHGTGGDEHQLMPLAEAIEPTWARLGLRGQEMEAGVHRRYFRRFAEGMLDEEDLARRAHEIADWLLENAPKERVAMGYSNGASIVGGLLLLRPESFENVVLLRPMVPLRPAELPDLKGKRALILASRTDGITPFSGAIELSEILSACGATVQVVEAPGGHGLTAFDVQAVQNWIAENFG